MLSVDHAPGLSAPVTASGGRLNLDSALHLALPTTPTVVTPNGGESLVPGMAASVAWKTNLADGVTAPGYRVEQTSNPLASQTLTTSFSSGVPSWLTQPSDSDAPWALSGTALRSGLARSQNDAASWVSAALDLSVPGQVRFSWRASTESCETPQVGECGDYFRFLVDGVEMMHASGVTGWQQASFPLTAGRHVLSWAYQKDFVCPEPSAAPECAGAQSVEDAAYVDDLSVEGVDAVSWSLLGRSAAGATSLGWTPSALLAAAKVRVCVDTGAPCQSASSDASDGPFTVGMVRVTATGGSTVVTEHGASDTVSVALALQPTAPVVVQAAPDAQLTVQPSSLTFTPGNWSTPQVLTLTAVDDAAVEASPHQGTVVLSGTSDDSRYSGSSIQLIAVSIVDDDRARSDDPGQAGGGAAASAGYWLVARDGGIFAFGDAAFQGSTGNIKLAQPIVTMASTATGKGYWLVAADGGIFAFGDAKFYGSTGNLKLAQPIVGMAPTPSGLGYWLVARDGGIFAFGDAKFQGSTGGIKLAQPIVAMAPTPSGQGYWLVASDGGIFAFGDAKFQGSTGGIKLAQPIVGMAPTPGGDGYWLVARDGGMFAFGSAVFRGSTGNIKLAQPIVSMAPTSSGKGYWLVASDGGIFAFGDAGFFGSTGGSPLNQPIVALGVRRASPAG
jgi:ribosomal protein L24E